MTAFNVCGLSLTVASKAAVLRPNQAFIFMMLVGFALFITCVLTGVFYVRNSVYQLEHNESALVPLLTTSVICLLALCVMQFFILMNRRMVRLGVVLFALLAGAWAASVFSAQSVLLSDVYTHQCHRLGYDTRLVMNQGGFSQLQLLDNVTGVAPVQLLAMRSYELDGSGGVRMDLNVTPPVLAPARLQVSLNPSGVNGTVMALSSSGWRWVGNVTFHRAGRGQFDLLLLPDVNGTGVRLSTERPFWRNPNRIVDPYGREVARILTGAMHSSRRLAICGSQHGLTLTLLLGAITQQFQAQGALCDGYHGQNQVAVCNGIALE